MHKFATQARHKDHEQDALCIGFVPGLHIVNLSIEYLLFLAKHSTVMGQPRQVVLGFTFKKQT